MIRISGLRSIPSIRDWLSWPPQRPAPTVAYGGSRCTTRSPQLAPSFQTTIPPFTMGPSGDAPGPLAPPCASGPHRLQVLGGVLLLPKPPNFNSRHPLKVWPDLPARAFTTQVLGGVLLLPKP